jgi:CRISPR/Cas system-associated endonuclease Cas1
MRWSIAADGSRASLAYDLMEPARPILDRWLLQRLQSVTFSKRDFVESHR